MQEITKKVQEIITKEKTVFVAFDGKEFEKKYECEAYEWDKKKEIFLKREDIQVRKDLGAPCDGGYWRNEDYDYIWIKPLTTNACVDMIETFTGDYFEPKDAKVNEWVCIEFDMDDEPTSYPEKNIKQAIISQFDALGYDVIFTKRKEQ